MKKKILLTISLSWIILVGYLVWANGLMNEGSKNFKWDELCIEGYNHHYAEEVTENELKI